MDYKLFYSMVIEEQDRLTKLDVCGNPRDCKALAAMYELQDYLANRIADEDGRISLEDLFEN